MKYRAIIGSRKPTKKQIEICRLKAKEAIENGYGIITGAAEGIDQIAVNEANKVDSSLVWLILPWWRYERHIILPEHKVTVYNPKIHRDWTESVYKYHPGAKYLSQGAFKLHARNYGIIINAIDVVALPSNKPGYGGTGQGIRIAKDLGISIEVFVDGQKFSYLAPRS